MKRNRVDWHPHHAGRFLWLPLPRQRHHVGTWFSSGPSLAIRTDRFIQFRNLQSPPKSGPYSGNGMVAHFGDFRRCPLPMPSDPQSSRYGPDHTANERGIVGIMLRLRDPLLRGKCRCDLHRADQRYPNTGTDYSRFTDRYDF
jgi:hypothetical protein